MSTLISFDYAIKYLLKDKGNYDIVEGFISAILQAEGYPAVKITSLLESESNKEEKDLKRSVADLMVRDEQGVFYIVEIERISTETFLHKACFNTSRLIVDTLESGNDYQTIKKVFHISLLYFAWSNSQKALHHGKTIFKEMDSEHPIDLQLVTEQGKTVDLSPIFPEYFLISVPLFDDIIRSELDEWLYVVKHSEVKADFKSPYMQKVAKRLNVLTLSQAEKYTYEKYMREIYIQRDQMNAATHAAKEEGIVIGEARGKAEALTEVVKNLQAQGVSIDLIKTATGLSLNEIQSILVNS